MSNYYTVTATLPNGKRKYYRGKTRKEAEEKRDRDRMALGLGVRIDDKTRFRDFAETWFMLRKDLGLHQKSIDTIRITLDAYILPNIGNLVVKDIKPYDIRVLMHRVSQYSRSVQLKTIQYTRSILCLAVENSLLASNPALPSIKAGGRKPEEVEVLTDEQCRRLLEVTKGTRVWLFLMVLRYAGLRRGEALGLMWSDIDFDKGTLSVRRSLVWPVGNLAGEINPDCKTAASIRTIPMVSVLSAALREAKSKSRSVYVFSMKDGKFLSEGSFRSMWKLIETRSRPAGKNYKSIDRGIDFRVHSHQLRHTCATAWIRSGMDPKQVMYLMGHSSLDMTLEIYSHYEEELRREEAKERMEKAICSV